MARLLSRCVAGRAGLLVALTLAVAMPPSVAAGQPTDDDVEARRAAAQDLADSAYDLLQKGRYATAADLFRKADQTFHSPVFVVFVAEAEEKQGNLLAARKLLKEVVDEKLAEYAPDAFRRAQEDAATRLAAIEDRLPKIVIEVEGEGATVRLDGVELSPSELARPIFVVAGEHRVEASAGDLRDEESVEVGEGESRNVRLVVSAGVADEPEGVGGDEPPGEGVPYWVWPTVAYGVGAAGLIMGVAAGGAFLSKQSKLKEDCAADDGDETTCPPDLKDRGDSVLLLGDVSTAGWVIAGLGAVAGTVLVVLPLALDDEDGESSVEVRLSPTSLGIAGRF
ncbi:MAG: hypothetical protein KC731_15295 [Myxococcales bacterium]|nr:hypothetical protein [Myxococcales bacterium]